jgi:hypothetical protein
MGTSGLAERLSAAGEERRSSASLTGQAAGSAALGRAYGV